MYVRSIEIPIYDIDIIIAIHHSHQDVIHKFRLDLNPDDYNDSRAFTFTDYVSGKMEIYMWFNPCDLDYNTIFHEHMHVLSYFSEHRDIKFDYDNDEPFAYFGAYVGEEIMKIIDKYKQVTQKTNTQP